jgi:dihydrofolate reductase
VKIVVSEFMSLDGVIQAPGGPEEDTDGGFAHGGWSIPFFDPQVMGPKVSEGMETTEALLFGRRTWTVMAGAWPGRAGDPFADQMNAIPKYVVSGTLTEADIDWNGTTLIPADGAMDAIAELRAKPGGDLQVMGSASLARALVAAGLVDELKLMIEPVVLGGGKRLFPEDGVGRKLELLSHTLAGTGVQICTYRVTDEPLDSGHSSDEFYE